MTEDPFPSTNPGNDAAAVRQVRQVCRTNGYHPTIVYSPGARFPNGKPVPRAGKRPFGKDWQRLALNDPPDAITRAVSSVALNTGILAGEVSGLDVDILDQGLVDQVVHRIEQVLGPTPLSRIGRAPKILLCYRAPEPFAKLSTPIYRMPDGTEAQFEILGVGQQITSFGLHPDTLQPYVWCDRSPLDFPFADLPTIDVMQARELVGEVDAILIEAGGVVITPAKPDRPPGEPGKRLASQRLETSEHASFWSAVNSAALDNISAWAGALHPKFCDCGNSGWRLSSSDLGRNLEEDISVHPNGIRDFGEGLALTPIDLAIRFKQASEAPTAALWLCEKLGIAPTTLGWRKRNGVSFCDHCGLEFTPQRSSARFCSTRCRMAAHRVPDSSVTLNRPVADLSVTPEPPVTPGPGVTRANTGESNPAFQVLTLSHWLDRDVPEPDFILGEVISTTSRVMLVGPTGLGKTMLGLALARALAEGRDFLHWHIPKPRRVLYLDGEMSRRLMKKRVVDEFGRGGGDRETNLYLLSREDFPDIAPLNTDAGQHFIDAVIEALGGIDVAIVDNIQAWTVGDQREESTWEPCLPWVRSLTMRSIAQLWLHHTGLDETHSYGPKAREWQLDTVMLMEALLDDALTSDLAFRLRFPKARERTPDNRHDFADAVIALNDDEWSSTISKAPPRGKPGRVRLEDYALDCLTAALGAAGTEVHDHPRVGPQTIAVTTDTWRRFFVQNYVGEALPESVDKMFYRFAGRLQAQQRIRVEKPWVWRP